MRECAVCHSRTEAHVVICPQCGADLNVDSVRARALKQIRQSPRSKYVYIAAPAGACPVCQRGQGSWPKNSELVPQLPHEGCSCPQGCVCRYEPMLVEVGP